MRTYGLLGKSLTHSFSKDYFEKKFASPLAKHLVEHLSENLATQLPQYLNIELDSIDNIRDRSEFSGLTGFNVTIPYKQEIIQYLDELTPEAKAIGAVNCVEIIEGRWKGHNTDFIGFRRTLLPLIENRVENALILGTGGASLAVAYVLKELGIRFFFVSRVPQNEQTCSYEQVTPLLLEKCKLIVNTTPVGQFPNVNEKPNLPYSSLTNQHVLYDLIYNPETTAFLQEGISRGTRYCNGRTMLEIQAEESYKIWNTLSE
jgi:shikimate dehydrogenase